MSRARRSPTPIRGIFLPIRPQKWHERPMRRMWRRRRRTTSSRGPSVRPWGTAHFRLLSEAGIEVGIPKKLHASGPGATEGFARSVLGIGVLSWSSSFEFHEGAEFSVKPQEWHESMLGDGSRLRGQSSLDLCDPFTPPPLCKRSPKMKGPTPRSTMEDTPLTQPPPPPKSGKERSSFASTWLWLKIEQEGQTAGFGPFHLGQPIWLWVKTNGIPFWSRCTTHSSLF